jgi:predicted Zn-dependent peptidase
MTTMAGLGLLGLVATASPAPAGGPGALSSLAEGQPVAGHFRLRRIYQGPAGEPRGARFLHATGMPVDVLFFPSAPRLSLYARTLPVSDKGEPHTGEHLLLGKGRTGRQLSGLMEMRLGHHSAETHPDLVCYHFRAAVGPDDFQELIAAMLTALLRPDYTDEEIRREVAHVEAVPGPGGSLRLEEKGTVYNEMVSTVSEPNSVIWRQVRALGYGAGHPLAREAGGLPEGIRTLSPAEVRSFHAANYHLGPNMAMVAVIPLAWSAEDFLARLHAVLAKAEPEPPALEPAPMPPPRPATPARIQIGKFPSADRSSSQGVVLSWPPLPRLTLGEEFRLNLLLSMLAGGQTSLLHRDLVDGKTRLLDTGATGVGTYLDDGLLPLPTISVGGLRLDAITRPTLTRLRDQIQRRIRWLADLPPGSPELAQVSERARSLLRSQRRSVLKALDDAPGFGSGNAAAGWHRYLDTLEREGGFRAPLLPEAIFAELDRDLLGGGNPWRPIVERAGLLARPHVIAAVPDPALLARDRARREARIRRELRALRTRLRARTEQAALHRFKDEFDAATREIRRATTRSGCRASSPTRPWLATTPPSCADSSPVACRWCAPTSSRRCSPTWAWPSTCAASTPPTRR